MRCWTYSTDSTLSPLIRIWNCNETSSSSPSTPPASPSSFLPSPQPHRTKAICKSGKNPPSPLVNFNVSADPPHLKVDHGSHGKHISAVHLVGPLDITRPFPTRFTHNIEKRRDNSKLKSKPYKNPKKHWCWGIIRFGSESRRAPALGLVRLANKGALNQE